MSHMESGAGGRRSGLRDGLRGLFSKRGYLRSTGRIVVGRETNCSSRTLVLKGKESVTFGSFCAIGDNLRVITAGHHLHLPALQARFYRKRFAAGYPSEGRRAPVTFGSDVWVGDNVTVLSGVTVGDGACLGAGCVVTKDVPPYSVAAGVPARVIKYRFEKPVVELLLEMRWWDWPDEKIQKNETFFMTDLSAVGSLDEIRKLIR